MKISKITLEEVEQRRSEGIYFMGISSRELSLVKEGRMELPKIPAIVRIGKKPNFTFMLIEED
jgi:hypothetical protein